VCNALDWGRSAGAACRGPDRLCKSFDHPQYILYSSGRPETPEMHRTAPAGRCCSI
jgi:hypothetical protein